MICEDLESFNKDNIIVNEAIKNSVIQYNYFYKLLYSTDNIILSSIFILFELNNITIDNDKVFLNNNNNNNIFNKLIALEEYILNLINESKTKSYKFRELYENNFFKFSPSDDNERFNNYKNITNLNIKNNSKKFILKISGIWESKDNIGLTFKIIGINKTLDFM